MRDDEVLRRLTSVRQFQQAGRRAPHKPLLILLALGRIATTGSSRLDWTEVERDLAQLVTEFGRPNGPQGAQAAAYPFTRLRADGVWTLSRDVSDDRLGDLREGPIHGQLDDSLERALRDDPALLQQAAVQVTLGQFPATMAADILQAVGLDPENPAAGPGQPQSLATTNGADRQRSAKWRTAILLAWDSSCAFCGYDGMLGGSPVGLEAAHVRWFNFNGPNTPDNGLALCSLHHKLLDRGALGFITPDTIAVSATFTARGPVARSIYDLHRQRLRPRPGTSMPANEHVHWHRNEVFRAPALT